MRIRGVTVDSLAGTKYSSLELGCRIGLDHNSGRAVVSWVGVSFYVGGSSIAQDAGVLQGSLVVSVHLSSTRSLPRGVTEEGKYFLTSFPAFWSATMALSNRLRSPGSMPTTAQALLRVRDTFVLAKTLRRHGGSQTAAQACPTRCDKKLYSR